MDEFDERVYKWGFLGVCPDWPIPCINEIFLQYITQELKCVLSFYCVIS